MTNSRFFCGLRPRSIRLASKSSAAAAFSVAPCCVLASGPVHAHRRDHRLLAETQPVHINDDQVLFFEAPLEQLAERFPRSLDRLARLDTSAVSAISEITPA